MAKPCPTVGFAHCEEKESFASLQQDNSEPGKPEICKECPGTCCEGMDEARERSGPCSSCRCGSWLHNSPYASHPSKTLLSHPHFQHHQHFATSSRDVEDLASSCTSCLRTTRRSISGTNIWQQQHQNQGTTTMQPLCSRTLPRSSCWRWLLPATMALFAVISSTGADWVARPEDAMVRLGETVTLPVSGR